MLVLDNPLLLDQPSALSNDVAIDVIDLSPPTSLDILYPGTEIRTCVMSNLENYGEKTRVGE
jgi:hypothetical protein